MINALIENKSFPLNIQIYSKSDWHAIACSAYNLYFGWQGKYCIEARFQSAITLSHKLCHWIPSL